MDKVRLLRNYLTVFGLINVFAISFTIPLAFGDLLLWSPRNMPDEMMIGSMYLAMGIVMICAARNPLAHKSFVDFVIVANVLHAIVMTAYARNVFHLVVDVTSIGLMGVLPLLFYPWGVRFFLRYGQGLPHREDSR